MAVGQYMGDCFAYLNYYCPFAHFHVMLFRAYTERHRVPKVFKTWSLASSDNFGPTSESSIQMMNKSSIHIQIWAVRMGRRTIRSVPRMPEQNGAVERAGRTLSETRRSLMVDARLPENLFLEV